MTATNAEKKISDEASTCPGCGCPTKYAQEVEIYSFIFGCLLLLGFSIFSWWGFNKIFLPDEDPWDFLKGWVKEWVEPEPEPKPENRENKKPSRYELGNFSISG